MPPDTKQGVPELVDNEYLGIDKESSLRECKKKLHSFQFLFCSYSTSMHHIFQIIVPTLYNLLMWGRHKPFEDPVHGS